MKKIRDIFSGNEGFTLIELLIVIVIIGVLAAIAVPNIAGLGDNADIEAVRANMRTLMVELEAQKAQDYDFTTVAADGTGSIANLAGTGDFSGAVALNNQDITITGNIDTDNDSANYTDYTFTTGEDFDGGDIQINNGAISQSTSY